MCVYGLIVLSIWPTVFGIVVVFLGKTWFLDRMVRIYEEMKDANSEYRSWLYQFYLFNNRLYKILKFIY